MIDNGKLSIPSSKCTGCSACFSICPKHAISMQKDKEGFLGPVIDSSVCVECGVCEKICPVNSEFRTMNDVSPKVFALWSVPDRILSSSGGAFSAIARYIIGLGGGVFGAVLSKENVCYHSFTDSIDGLAAMRQSKYMQSELGDVFSEVKHFLLNDRWVLFTGTPCQVAGLYSYLKIKYDKLITLDLVCHGVPSSSILNAYLTKLSKLSKRFKDIQSISFRMCDGWGLSPSVKFIDGHSKQLYGLNNLYMEAFNKSALFRKSCYDCQFAKLPRVGDFSIADFWGIGRHGTPFKHNVDKGVSLVLVNNAKKEYLIPLLKECYVEERSLEEALIENHNITQSSRLHPMRDAIITSFLDSSLSLIDIENEYHLVDRSLKACLKNIAIRLSLMKFAKQVYNRIVTL